MAKALTVTSAVPATVPATVSATVPATVSATVSATVPAAVSTVAMSASKRRCRNRQGGRRERESGNSNEFLDPVHGLLLDFGRATIALL
jgi:hypothetical protein